MPEPLPTRMLGGKLLLRQPASGHRAGTDAVLLAAAIAPATGGIVVDVGSGVGTVGLMLALREPAVDVVLVEVEPSLAALARENVGLNGLGARVSVHNLDVFADPTARCDLAGKAAMVVSNPPFHMEGTVRRSPDQLKARAHGLGETKDHGDWLRAMLLLLQPHGKVVIIHRPEALSALMEAAQGRLGGLCIRPIHPREGEPATRILFGGIAGSRAPLTIASALVLHEMDGSFRPLVQAMHRGEAVMPLFSK